MSKSITNQRLIYKIHSDRFVSNNWNLSLDFDTARRNQEVVSLGDSIALRMIRRMKGNKITDEEINKIKNKKKKAKDKRTVQNLNKKLNQMKFEEDYIVIVFDKVAHWNYATNSKNKVILNGKRFVRLIGTNGGIKNNSVVFINEKLHSELDKKLNNSRNTKIPYVPAKFEAYKALAFSGSTPVTQPRNILVIKDGTNVIKEDVLKLSDNGKGGFDLHEEKDCEIEVNYTDGCGMIRPSLMEQWAIDLGEFHYDEQGNKVANYIPSGANIRNFSTKGMVATIPFEEYADEIGEYMVEDIWGDMVDIREVDLILTDNMVKLWNGYNSCDEFMKACKKNWFEFCVAKLLPEELEHVRNMNYQFLQSYEFSDEDIEELIKPTVDTIKGALGLTCNSEQDYAKMLLFLKGKNITKKDFIKEENDFIKALMINKEMINDPYIKTKVHNMIKKRINDAKKGVIQVNGNYSVILGDLYGMLQHMFKKEVTGALKKNEFYAKTWTDKGVNEIVSFRAPMTIHNNIVKMKLVENETTKKYFRYIKVCTVFNMYGTTMEALNGADFDADAIISTDNEVILRNTKKLPTVICEQKTSEKHIITEKLLTKANRNGFNNNVGSITNRCTAMYDVLAKFNKGTKEYNEMLYRIICMQGYQQEIIDSCKGIIPKKVPKEWYDYGTVKNIEDEEEREFYLNLLADKKPYFFIYNYKYLKKQFSTHKKDYESNCVLDYGIKFEELIAKNNKTKEEQDFINNYYLYSPISFENSTMNKICGRLEEELDNLIKPIKESKFDTNILTTDKKATTNTRNKIKEIYEEYKKFTYTTTKGKKDEENQKEYLNAREIFKALYKDKLESVAKGDYEVITNTLVDICYNKTLSKQFVWSSCGEYIVAKLLKDNNYKINIPVIDKKGTIEWQGINYKLEQREVIIDEQ